MSDTNKPQSFRRTLHGTHAAKLVQFRGDPAMKRLMYVFGMVLTAGQISYASDPACPEVGSQILKSLGLADSVGHPGASTNLSNEVAPNGIAYQQYVDPVRKIKVELSARFSDGGSSVSMIYGDYKEINPNQGPGIPKALVLADSSAKLIQLVYDKDCKVESVLRNRAEGSEHELYQSSASAKFCNNLNAGQQPTQDGIGANYLQFPDRGGDIASDHEADTRSMCKEVAGFLG
jgi:hypothetical protein